MRVLITQISMNRGSVLAPTRIKRFNTLYHTFVHRSLFALGRTETVHPMSQHSHAWLAAMADPTETSQHRIDLLRKAVRHQSDFRLRATVGQGCDRHLLGLYCASRELGMDVPAIFLDKVSTLGELVDQNIFFNTQ